MAVAEARFTRHQYDELVRRDLLAPDLRVELIRGRIVEVSPQKPPHAQMIRVLHRLFVEAGHVPDVQLPLAATDDSEPEPDLALGGESSAAEHPTTAQLVVEVAWTQIAEAWEKAGIYAEAGVPTYWIVDIPARTVHVLEDPQGDRYRSHRELTGDDVLRTAAAAGVELTVAALFGRAGL